MDGTQGGQVTKYVSRAPRYILQPDDNTLIRLAGPQQTPWEEGTEIQNISLSGLAFVAPVDLSPLIGEIVKIQFEVPEASQLACFGLVTRLEQTSKSSMLVGLKFMKLDFPQRLYLSQALTQKVKEQQRERELQHLKMLIRGNLPKIFMAWLLLCIWMVATYLWMSGQLYILNF